MDPFGGGSKSNPQRGVQVLRIFYQTRGVLGCFGTGESFLGILCKANEQRTSGTKRKHAGHDANRKDDERALQALPDDLNRVTMLLRLCC